MKNYLFALALSVLALISAVQAQEPAPAPDGRQHNLQDELLEQMAGRWKLSGTIRGKGVEHSVEAQWCSITNSCRLTKRTQPRLLVTKPSS
jgi:hypothetical protein